MRRAATLGALCLVALCVAGAWFALPGAERFAVPGAQELRLAHTGTGAQLITFRVAADAPDWAYQLDRALRARGWLPPDYSGAVAQWTIYTHVVSFGFGALWEEVDISGDQTHAQIVLRRWLRLPWLSDERLPFG